MPFGLRNAPSEFQNIMNDIFTPFTEFSIVYIDDVLIFSKSIEDHWKHLEIFVNINKHNGLVVLATRIKLFQDKIRFLGHNIYRGTLSPIDKAIQFVEKFSDEIKDKNQLQRFLGSLNNISDYFQGLRKICRPLYKRLEKNPPPWICASISLIPSPTIRFRICAQHLMCKNSCSKIVPSQSLVTFCKNLMVAPFELALSTVIVNMPLMPYSCKHISIFLPIVSPLWSST